MAKRRKIWRRCGSEERGAAPHPREGAEGGNLADVPQLTEIAQGEGPPKFARGPVEIGLAGKLVDPSRVGQEPGYVRL